MMQKRLTTKNTRLTNWLSTGHITKENEELFCNCYNKLVHIEDLEEEIGIDLVTLFKALSSKELWWKTTTYGIQQTTFDQEGLRPSVYCYEKWTINLVFGSLDDDVLLSDYGITWALTKEELEENDA